jgi:hypothetical protein
VHFWFLSANVTFEVASKSAFGVARLNLDEKRIKISME